MTSLPPSFAKAKTIGDFVRLVEAFPLISGSVIYRGQAVKGNLIPSIARQNPSVDTTAVEREMLTQLGLLGATLVSPPVGDLDLLVVAQHFGLKTRLLDWTSNPLAALWFACSDRSPGDAYVYVLESENLLSKDLYSKDPFDQPATRVFQPRQNNPRIVSQHGWFTLHRYSTADGGFTPLERNAKTKTHLTEIVVPASSREDMLESLERLGTSHRTLFPDLEGLCRYINWKHSVA